VGAFLHASPTAASKKGGTGGAPARVGEDFQVEVLSIADYESSATERARSIASMTTRGSSSGSAVYWNSSSAEAEDPTGAEGQIVEYLSRAWEIIDRLKAEKLSEYYQSERESLLDGTENKDGESAAEMPAEPQGGVGKEVQVLDGTFVTVNKEAEEVLLHNFTER